MIFLYLMWLFDISLCLLCTWCIYCNVDWSILYFCFFFFQAEDGIRDLVRSRGLGDVYKRQLVSYTMVALLPVDSSDQGFFPLIPKFLAICTVSSVFYGILSYFAKLQEIRPFVNKAVKLFKKPVIIQ